MKLTSTVRLRTKAFFVKLLFLVSLQVSAEGLVEINSTLTVAEATDKIEAQLIEKGMRVFARINHAQGAKSVGNTLPDTELLIFGNPKIGSPLMLCSGSLAIDLPQKMLVRQVEEVGTVITYNDPVHLAKRHGIKSDSPCFVIIQKVAGALAKFAKHGSE